MGNREGTSSVVVFPVSAVTELVCKQVPFLLNF